MLEEQEESNRAIEMERKHLKLVKLGVSLSWEFIIEPRVDNAVTAFIVSAEKTDSLSREQANRFELLLSVMKEMPEKGPKYLGRLEIIYQLADTSLRKVPLVETTQYPPQRSNFRSFDHCESSDEQLDEEWECSSGTDFIAGTADMADVDWGW